MPTRKSGKQKKGRGSSLKPLFLADGSSQAVRTACNPQRRIQPVVITVGGKNAGVGTIVDNDEILPKLIRNKKLCDPEILKILDETDLMVSLKMTFEELTQSEFFKGSPHAIVQYKDITLMTARLFLYEEMCKPVDLFYAPQPPSSASNEQRPPVKLSSLESFSEHQSDAPAAVVDEESSPNNCHVVKGALEQVNVIHDSRGRLEAFHGVMSTACMENRRRWTKDELIAAKAAARKNRDFGTSQKVGDGQLVEQVTFPDDFYIGITAASLNGAAPRDWLVKMGYCDFNGVPIAEKQKKREEAAVAAAAAAKDQAKGSVDDT